MVLYSSSKQIQFSQVFEIQNTYTYIFHLRNKNVCILGTANHWKRVSFNFYFLAYLRVRIIQQIQKCNANVFSITVIWLATKLRLLFWNRQNTMQCITELFLFFSTARFCCTIAFSPEWPQPRLGGGPSVSCRQSSAHQLSNH